MSFRVEGKTVSVFCQSEGASLPVAYVNSFEEEGRQLFDECLSVGCRDFVLVCVSGIDWNDDMSPWPMEPLYRRDRPYGGKAGEYLRLMEEKIVPEAEGYITEQLKKDIGRRIIGGYSLAGLFALYSAFNSSLFSRVMSASGSLWYPSFREYAGTHELNGCVEKLYLSLGNKEAEARNPVLARVGEDTLAIRDLLKGSAEVFYEENEGNHFRDPLLRTAKGIRYLAG